MCPSEGYGVNKNNYLTKELNIQVKKVIVDTAKEWDTYFCRLFPVAVSSLLFVHSTHTLP